jgi:hypothetical protein
MSDQRRERQQLREALEITNQLGQQVGLSPEIRAIQSMRPAARVALYQLDLLRSIAGAMGGQCLIEQAPELAAIFPQIVQVIGNVRAQVFEKESAGIVIAGPGDLPPPGTPPQ